MSHLLSVYIKDPPHCSPLSCVFISCSFRHSASFLSFDTLILSSYMPLKTHGTELSPSYPKITYPPKFWFFWPSTWAIIKGNHWVETHVYFCLALAYFSPYIMKLIPNNLQTCAVTALTTRGLQPYNLKPTLTAILHSISSSSSPLTQGGKK